MHEPEEEDDGPRTIEEMEAYIAAAGSPFERLARTWECESEMDDARPWENTPKATADARLTAFWRMWEQVT